jgi:hypothetical protein
MSSPPALEMLPSGQCVELECGSASQGFFLPDQTVARCLPQIVDLFEGLGDYETLRVRSADLQGCKEWLLRESCLLEAQIVGRGGQSLNTKEGNTTFRS